MTNKQKELVFKLVTGPNIEPISKEEFLENFEIKPALLSQYVMGVLKTAIKEKNADDVELALIIGCAFKLFTKEFADILCQLIEEQWHYEHENIASIFQGLKLPETVEALYRTAISRFEYLDFDEAYALAVKCIWALGEINNIESRIKLEILAEAENEVIKKNAIYQLERYVKI